ncbi:MAG: glycerol-3-phosphate 1-O-acyltransferase PlsY [Gammaproteobacteria bacterium]
MLTDITCVVLAYFLGSISSAILIARLLGLSDPRSQGSGNPGATNMLRVGGKGAAVVTLLGDMLKGVLVVLLARALGGSEVAIAGAAIAAFLGHLYPVFFGFKGGKGVATLFGTLLGLNWLVGVLVLGTWLLVAFLFRYSSLAALIASALAPAYLAWLQPVPAFIIAACAMVALLFWRHRSNIAKLRAGTEGKIGGK